MGQKILQTIVIGGGVVGLTCAAELVNAKQTVLVLEAQPEVGGHFSEETKLTTELRNHIERYRGEVVTDITATKIKRGKTQAGCCVDTNWGAINAKQVVIALEPSDQVKIKFTRKELPGLVRQTETYATIAKAKRAGKKMAQSILAGAA